MNRHSRSLVTAVDRVIDHMAAGYRCPFCPGDVTRDHNRGCVATGLLRARDEFVRIEDMPKVKKASQAEGEK